MALFFSVTSAIAAIVERSLRRTFLLHRRGLRPPLLSPERPLAEAERGARLRPGHGLFRELFRPDVPLPDGTGAHRRAEGGHVPLDAGAAARRLEDGTDVHRRHPPPARAEPRSWGPKIRSFDERTPFRRRRWKGQGASSLYELAYVAFYYLAWEFAFRGVVLFGLLAFLPHTIPGIAVAIMVQTFLSTIYHIGHPHSEVFGAFILGLCRGGRGGRHRLDFVRLVLPRAGRCLERLPRVS